MTDTTTETQSDKFLSRIASKIKSGAKSVLRALKIISKDNAVSYPEYWGHRTRKQAYWVRNFGLALMSIIVTLVAFILLAAIFLIEVALRFVGFVVALPLYMKRRSVRVEFKTIATGTFLVYGIRTVRDFSDYPDLINPLTPSDFFEHQSDWEDTLTKVADDLQATLDSQKESKGKPTPKQKKSTAGRTAARAHAQAHAQAKATA